MTAAWKLLQARALSRAAKNNFQEGDAYETMQFYYHPDHLGSSSYITNLDGEVVQHIEYVPFGEVFVGLQQLDRKISGRVALADGIICLQIFLDMLDTMFYLM